jgi:DNA-binding response OmpR family regulator
MDGVEAASCIRESHSELPILALTGVPEMIDPAHRDLFAEILTKPTSVQQLSAIVSTHVNSSRGDVST